MTAVGIEQSAPDGRSSRPLLHSPLTSRELLVPIFYYRRLAIFAFLLPLALAVVVAALARPIYIAESRLLILLGNEYVFRGDAGAATPGLSFDRAQIVQAEIEILAAKDLHTQAIEQIGLARVYPSLANAPHGLETAAVQFAKDLNIQNVPQSNVVELTLRNHDPKVAADVLNALIDLYIQRRREVFQQANPGKIESERDQLQVRLRAIDGQIARFAADQGFGDYDQAVAAAQANQAAMITQMQNLDQQYATRLGRSHQLDQRSRQAPASLELYSDRARSQQLDNLTSNLLALQAQRRDAAAKYTDGYPLIVDLDRRIAALQGVINAAPNQQISGVRVGVNPIRQTLDTELADSESDVAGLRQGRTLAARGLRDANDRLQGLVAIGPQYRELVRNRAVVEAAYSSLAKRTEDARLEDTLSRSQANVRVIQRAEPPVEGKTGRALLLVGGLLLGLATSGAAVLFASAFSEGMVTPRDIEQKLNVPILLAVPWRAGGAKPKRAGLNWGAGALLNLDDIALLLRLAASIAPKSGRVIQLIAPDEGAGVSSLALDLAIQAANKGARRVLLLDVEPLKDQSAAARLGAVGVKLRRTENPRTVQVETSSLYVSHPTGARDLRIDEKQWVGVLSAARQSYDVVIVDAPATARSTAGIVIAPFVDMTLLIVEAERTRAAVARNLIDRVDTAGGEVIGAILNKRRFHIPPSIYSRL